jgi:hypothetical protein
MFSATAILSAKAKRTCILRAELMETEEAQQRSASIWL